MKVAQPALDMGVAWKTQIQEKGVFCYVWSGGLYQTNKQAAAAKNITNRIFTYTYPQMLNLQKLDKSKLMLQI